MTQTLIRAGLLYLCVVLAIRIMGKRQIGELQPNELVVTILISELAAIPMQDLNRPIANGIVAIFALVVLEILISIVNMKWRWARRVVNGRESILIRDGVIDRQRMRRLRFTVDDLMVGLRGQSVFDLSKVAYAIMDTDGKLSVLLKPAEQPATAGQMQVAEPDPGLPALLISDGRLRRESLADGGMTEQRLKELLDSRRLKLCDVFVMTVDKTGRMTIVAKTDTVPAR